MFSANIVGEEENTIYAGASGAVILLAMRVDQILANAARIGQNDAELVSPVHYERCERVLMKKGGKS